MRITGAAAPLFAAALLHASMALAGPEFEEMLGKLDRLRAEANVAGLGLLVVDGNRVEWCGGLGVADRRTGLPVRSDSMVRVGSITKAFTGLGMLVADRLNLLPLDAEVADLLAHPPYRNPWADTRPVTVEQLLEHTAGLRDMSRREFDFNQPVPLAQALDVDPESRTLAWPPGLHSSYSNSGAGIAAYVFERKTGRDFEAFVTEQVFTPLGMDSATFRWSEAVEAALIAGYDSDGESLIPYWHQLYRPFGAINVELGDMAPFLEMLISGGRLHGRTVFSAGEIRRMETPRTGLAASVGLQFGYGLGNYAYVHDGFVFHGHGGDADGYLSFYAYNRDVGRGYFLVINAFQNRTLRRMRGVVESYLVRDAEADFAAPVPQPGKYLASLAGIYRPATSRFKPGKRSIQVEFSEGRLWLKRGERREVLLPLDRWRFRRRFEPVATTAFISHEDGLYLQGPFGNYVRAR